MGNSAMKDNSTGILRYLPLDKHLFYSETCIICNTLITRSLQLESAIYNVQ